MTNLKVLLLMGAMIFLCVACDDDSDGDDGPSEMTKAQLADELCGKMATCDDAMYQQAGGEAGCPQMAAAQMFSEADCPAADYDAGAAAQCAQHGVALSCDQFMASVNTIISGTGISYFSDACDTMCGGIL